MSYTKIQRYQRLSPDLQTEWGTFTNPNITFNPDQYKYRQPAVPMLARSRTDVIHPQSMGQGLGYVGDYVPGPMGENAPPSTFLGMNNDTLKTVLVLAGIALVLYLLFRDKGAKKNPSVADLNTMLDTGWTPPEGWSPPGGSHPSRRGRQTREGKKSLRRYANTRSRDSKGRFV